MTVKTAILYSLRRSVAYILWILDRLAEKNKVETSKTLKHSLTPFLKHQGQTAEEQLQKNQAAMKLLKGWIEEEVSEEELKDREKYFDSFKEIVDNERPIGYKLYSK